MKSFSNALVYSKIRYKEKKYTIYADVFPSAIEDLFSTKTTSKFSGRQTVFIKLINSKIQKNGTEPIGRMELLCALLKIGIILEAYPSKSSLTFWIDGRF